jgi:hypothetical protein
MNKKQWKRVPYGKKKFELEVTSQIMYVTKKKSLKNKKRNANLKFEKNKDK